MYLIYLQIWVLLYIFTDYEILEILCFNILCVWCDKLCRQNCLNSTGIRSFDPSTQPSHRNKRVPFLAWQCGLLQINSGVWKSLFIIVGVIYVAFAVYHNL